MLVFYKNIVFVEKLKLYLKFVDYRIMCLDVVLENVICFLKWIVKIRYGWILFGVY